MDDNVGRRVEIALNNVNVSEGKNRKDNGNTGKSL